MQQGPNYIESSGTAGRERPPGRQGDLVLLCGREEFCSEARHELERRRKDLRIADADGLAGARQILGEESPAVILAEERALAEPGGPWRARRQAIESALSLLAGSAPVVWIGAAEEGAQLTQAVHSGAVDFVPRSALCLPAAVTMVERRLRGLARPAPPGRAPRAAILLTELRAGRPRFRRSASPRTEQSPDRYSGKRGTAAARSAQRKARSAAAEAAAPRDHRGAGRAHARDRAAPERPLGSRGRKRLRGARNLERAAALARPRLVTRVSQGNS